MQYPTTPYLSKYIKHYLVFDIPSNGPKRYRHFSNGHNGIVFTLKKEEFVSINSKTALPETFIFKQVSENQDFYINGATSIVIVLFQPFGLYNLTGIPANNFVNDFQDSYLIFGKGILKLKNQLQSCSNLSGVINHLNSFFTQKIKSNNPLINPFLSNSIQLVHNKKGDISVNDLCSQIGVTERKMQRMFSKQIGVSPKKFICNIRLHFFLSLLRNEKDFLSLTNLSLQAGYYDQAHLIKEFKKIVGLAPSSYQKTKHLAVNLIEF